MGEAAKQRPMVVKQFGHVMPPVFLGIQQNVLKETQVQNNNRDTSLVKALNLEPATPAAVPPKKKMFNKTLGKATTHEEKNEFDSTEATNLITEMISQASTVERELAHAQQEVARLETKLAQAQRLVVATQGELADLKANVECTVCFDRPRCMATMPCGHLSLCSQCAHDLTTGLCPICRQPFIELTRIWFS